MKNKLVLFYFQIIFVLLSKKVMKPNFHEINGNHHSGSGGLYSQQQLKIKRDSHVIKKPTSSAPLSAAVVSSTKPRPPVIIYAHTPKVIQTDVKDFKALVQKLTGMPGTEEDLAPETPPHADNRDIDGPQNGIPEDRAEETERNKLVLSDNRNAIGANCKPSSVATIDAKIEEIGETSYSMFAHHPTPPAPAPPLLPLPMSIFDPSDSSSCFSTSSLFASDPDDNLFYGNQSFFDFDSDSSLFESSLRSSFSSDEIEGLTELYEL